MAKYGLGQIDLNLRACVALGGVTQNPEKDLIALLRSSQPIEPVTRLLLADALAGKSRSVTARITRKARSNGLQKFRTRLERLKAGRLALSERSTLRYNDAVQNVAEKFSASGKSIEANITLVRKIDGWIAGYRAARPELEHFTDRDLENAYVYAEAFGLDPDASCKASLPFLTLLVRHWQDLQTGGGDLNGDWTKP